MALETSHLNELLKLQHLGKSDLAFVNDLIRTHELSIVDIDRTINNLNREITLLRVRKQEHINHVTRCKGVVTLARRLPPEIIANIMDLCASTGWWRAPQVLSRVSSAYFQASRFSRVWSNVYVDCDDRNAYARTKYWLSMAQTSPLNIRLRTSNESIRYVSRIMELLNRYSSQWKSFTLEASSAEDANLALSYGVVNTGHLDELCIMVPVPFDGVASLNRLGMFKSITELRVECSSLDPIVTLPSRVEVFNLTLNSNTVLDPAACIASSIRLLATISHSLKVFTFNIHALQDTDAGDTPPNQLHQVPVIDALSLKEITFVMPPTFLRLLSHLRAPIVQALHFQSPSDPLLGPQPIVGELIARFLNTSPRVRLFELYDIDIPDSSFVNCFNLMGELREVRIHWSEVSDQPFEHLKSNSICPHLTRLDLRWCSQLNGGILADIVRQRATSRGSTMDKPCSISEIAILNCPFVEEKDILALAEMTTCRLILRPHHDLCRLRGCCNNQRYRQRFYLRHHGDLDNRKILI